MSLEVVILDVIAAQEREFQAALTQTAPIIAGMPGYISHQLQRCVEKQNRYILLVIGSRPTYCISSSRRRK